MDESMDLNIDEIDENPLNGKFIIQTSKFSRNDLRFIDDKIKS